MPLASALQGWLLDYFVETANTYPWMWGFYALAIVAPFVICAGCCVKSKVRTLIEAHFGSACACTRIVLLLCKIQ